ncbi:unnamed protein product [Cladocopium goreaui]|uniref:Glutamate decarboxylase n=1 Tax=Cladocopium goreaui TaxID=2562237 RepID=A0A9P1GM74_9DINO|nr:unnamed protein product [Cladocopium goreaui]
MQAKGYRSWFVAPPASHSVLGHAYTSGGVAIFVRKDKGAREVSRHVAYDGQAIMLQLDHMFIIGAYLPPRNPQATQTLTVLDEWIASAGALEPVVILGDFNQEPELADRWTALADGGAAKVVSLPDGTRASTRPPVQEAFQFWQEGSEPMPEYAWSNLTPKELHRQAIRMKGSAGGADGITGIEAAQLPLRITKIVLCREPQLFSLATFLDDRNMIARDPQQAFRLWQTWQEVSSRLGLWENDSKARVVPRRAAYEAQLVAQGFAQHHVTNAARVLSIDFTTRLGASDRKTSEERLRVTKSRLQRIALLPVGMHLKANMWRPSPSLKYGNVLANGLAAPPEAHGLALSEAGWKTWVGSRKVHFIGAAMHLAPVASSAGRAVCLQQNLM